MTTQNNTPQEKKEIAKSDDKNKEMDWREKIANNSAGDNEMMKNAIKFITHPIIMFGGILGFFYWLFKDKDQKGEIEKLQKENDERKKALEGLEKKHSELKTDHEKLKEEFSKMKEVNNGGFGMLPGQNKNQKTKLYQNNYLD